MRARTLWRCAQFTWASKRTNIKNRTCPSSCTECRPIRRQAQICCHNLLKDCCGSDVAIFIGRRALYSYSRLLCVVPDNSVLDFNDRMLYVPLSLSLSSPLSCVCFYCTAQFLAFINKVANTIDFEGRGVVFVDYEDFEKEMAPVAA